MAPKSATFNHGDVGFRCAFPLRKTITATNLRTGVFFHVLCLNISGFTHFLRILLLFPSRLVVLVVSTHPTKDEHFSPTNGYPRSKK